MSLPPSAGGELKLLMVPNAAGVEQVAARSYDGHPWEAVMPNPRYPICVGSACEITLGSLVAARIDTIVDSDPLTTARSASRFLMQSTFGPNQASLDALAATEAGGADVQEASLVAWMDEQAALPATLHRSYFRARVQLRVPFSGVWGGTTPCYIGSRWHSFVLNQFDQGSTLVVAADEVTEDSLVCCCVLFCFEN
jgi:hypothetical protein